MSVNNGLGDISKLVEEYFSSGGEITQYQIGQHSTDEFYIYDGWRVGNASSHEEEVENYLHGRIGDDERYPDYYDVPLMDILGW